MDMKGTDESLRSSFYLPSISWECSLAEDPSPRPPPPAARGLQSIKYTYLWSEKFSMATENFEMPFFYFIPKVLKICLYSSQSWHIFGYDLIFIALDMFIHIITL